METILFFSHDNDLKHTALNVCLWCLYNCPQVLKTSSQLPVLNPLEQILRERKHDIKTKCKQKNNDGRMDEHWFKNYKKKKLIKSIPIRLKAVMDAKGYPTKF